MSGHFLMSSVNDTDTHNAGVGMIGKTYAEYTTKVKKK